MKDFYGHQKRNSAYNLRREEAATEVLKKRQLQDDEMEKARLKYLQSRKDPMNEESVAYQRDQKARIQAQDKAEAARELYVLSTRRYKEKEEGLKLSEAIEYGLHRLGIRVDPSKRKMYGGTGSSGSTPPPRFSAPAAPPPPTPEPSFADSTPSGEGEFAAPPPPPPEFFDNEIPPPPPLDSPFSDDPAPPFFDEGDF
ncbi:MAG: hypothetical protein ACK5RO_07710 [Pseudobdellovibrionaceae bacterium]